MRGNRCGTATSEHGGFFKRGHNVRRLFVKWLKFEHSRSSRYGISERIHAPAIPRPTP